MTDGEEKRIEQYREGDIHALEELVEKYRRPLFGFILKMTEGRDDAEEIFQEVWLRAIRNLDSYKVSNFLSWLFKIAHNLVIDRARKKKPAMSLQDPIEEALTMEDRVASEAPGPDEQMNSRVIRERIDRAVAELPENQREVFVMRTQADISFKDIARIQGVSINTALARMQYALARLREELRTEYMELSGS
ncbi:MAG: sigma-70 family RNA polymerase sigma factor [Spartobacteria bacterium]|nr:sigma-70 family RNA polymerase sigma factor [Spartobacteria bacterium]